MARPSPTLYCSFCGKSQHEAKLIAGPNVFICNECVELCEGIIRRESTQQLMNAAAESAPGSNLALAQGCTCPVLDNDMGRGVGGDGPDALYWINGDCPLHGSVIVPAAGDVAALIAALDSYRERLSTDYRYRSSHAGLVIDRELGELLDPYRERRP